jgi:hypothetical protein
MTSSETPPWVQCLVCGHTDHTYRKHLNEVAVPAFVGDAVGHLRELERSGSHVDPLIEDMKHLVDVEDGGRKAWAIWLLKLLQELEDASDAPEVAAEIEGYLLGGYAG